MRLDIMGKGMLMGICDTVPGISGGTIAFITGIYERLLSAIKAFTPNAILNAAAVSIGKGDKERYKKDRAQADLELLIPLFIGIIGAILLFSRVMEFLLTDYFVFVMAFFIGLILGSAGTLFTQIEDHHSRNQFMSLAGFAAGVWLAFIVPATITPTSFMFILSGAIAISAMILPGISGSFILLIMGMYEPVIRAVSGLPQSFMQVVLFGIGAVIGLGTSVRGVSYIFKKNRCMTLYVLVGLVIGALSVPIRDIASQASSISSFGWVIMVLLGVIGVITASSIAKFNVQK